MPGVVWQAPDDYPTAAAELRKIRETGFRAVRTGILEDERLLALADGLGLALYQELPLAYWSGAALSDSLPRAMERLQVAVRRGARHPSARDFGVAVNVDTADPATCDVIRTLADAGQSAGAGVRFYYTTLFVEADRCSDAVDYVLIDARRQVDVRQTIARWYAAHDAAVGIASLGREVRPDAPAGLRSPDSQEQQARYLEQHLTDLLLDRSTRGVRVVFVDRWRDGRAVLPNPASVSGSYSRTSGLHTAQQDERPAYHVVRGILTGTQFAFALEQGEGSEREWPWPTIFGWIALFLIALAYAFSARMRQMVPRYFLAHGFYRDAVREGRDLLLGSSLVLLAAVSLATGSTLVSFIRVAGDAPALRIPLRFLSEPAVAFLAGAAHDPARFALLTAAFTAAAMLLWTVVMMIASRRGSRLGLGQALMLTIWPRWPFMLLMLAALAIAGSTDQLPEQRQVQAMAIVGTLWVLVALYAVVRTVIDFAAVTRAPAYATVFVLILSPSLLVLVVAAVLWLPYLNEVQFAVRTLLYR